MYGGSRFWVAVSEHVGVPVVRAQEDHPVGHGGARDKAVARASPRPFRMAIPCARRAPMRAKNTVAGRIVPC